MHTLSGVRLLYQGFVKVHVAWYWMLGNQPAYPVLWYTPPFLPSYYFHFLTNPPPHNIPMQPPTQHVQAFMTTCAWHSHLLDPIPLAPSAQLHVIDGQMTYIPDSCTLSISSSNQPPDLPYHRDQPVTSHCAMQLGTVAVSLQMSLVLIFLIINLYLNCLYLLYTMKMFSSRGQT